MKNILKLTAVLFTITAVVAALLAGANLLTKDRIAAAKREKTAAAVAAVLPNDTVESETAVDQGIVKTLYRGKNGCVVEVTPNGFGGEITLLVGVSKEGKVLGVQIVSHSETPGLGAKAQTDTEFLNSFLGLSGSVQVDKDGGEADTVTGATVTSRAVAEGVSAALEFAATLDWNGEEVAE